MKKAMYAMLVAGLMGFMAACGASDNGTVTLKDSSSGDATSGDSKPLTDESADATDDTYEPCDGSEYGAQKFFCRVAGTYTGVAEVINADTGFTMSASICTNGNTYQATLSKTGTLTITTNESPITATFSDGLYDNFSGPDGGEMGAENEIREMYRYFGSEIINISFKEVFGFSIDDRANNVVDRYVARVRLGASYYTYCEYTLTKQ